MCLLGSSFMYLAQSTQVYTAGEGAQLSSQISCWPLVLFILETVKVKCDTGAFL